RSVRIEASTVAADHLHFRMILEPTGRGRRRTIRQQIHHLTTLQIHDDRAVVGALPPRPVINASHMDRAVIGPSPFISLSERRPPALWPSSRTIPARRAVWRANGAARPGRRSVKMRRSHRWFRHLQRARRALMMTGAP